jgi:hypothetical protein
MGRVPLHPDEELAFGVSPYGAGVNRPAESPYGAGVNRPAPTNEKNLCS